MTTSYRSRVNALAVIGSAAFGGANLFIGASMGIYWLSLPPADFVSQFFVQFSNFLFRIMPLFLLMLAGGALFGAPGVLIGQAAGGVIFAAVMVRRMINGDAGAPASERSFDLQAWLMTLMHRRR